MSDMTIVAGDARRFDRGSWIALGFVVVMMLASIAATIATLGHLGDGCVYNSHDDEGILFGACVGGWATPLRAGDELIAVGGVDWQQSRAALIPRATPAGWVDNGTIYYTVQRAEQIIELEVPLHRMGGNGFLRAFGYGLVRQAADWNTFPFLGMIVIFMLAPRVRAAQLLLIAIGGLTAVTTLAWSSDSVGAYFATGPVWFLKSFLGLRRMKCCAWWMRPCSPSLSGCGCANKTCDVRRECVACHLIFREACQSGTCSRAAAGGRHRVPLGTKQIVQNATIIGLIINDQDMNRRVRRHGNAPSAGAAGR